MKEKPRLGRGLEALLGGPTNGFDAADGEQTTVAVDRIQHNPFQPRKAFDPEELSHLSDSIRTHGILQPLVVRKVGDEYQLVAGERRLRAAQAVGLAEVPVRLVNFNDQQVLEAALVENIHRADLNPIEKAQGFRDYLTRFHMTHEQLAERLGLDRSTITNLVGLLDLPAEVQEAVRLGQISAAHAKLLKGVPDPVRQVALCKEIIAHGLSVRATEAAIKEQLPENRTASAKATVEKTAHIQSIEDELRQKLAVRTEIRLKARDRGQIVLSFESNDDFERLLEVLRR